MFAGVEDTGNADPIGESRRHDSHVAAQATAGESLHAASPLNQTDETFVTNSAVVAIRHGRMACTRDRAISPNLQSVVSRVGMNSDRQGMVGCCNQFFSESALHSSARRMRCVRTHRNCDGLRRRRQLFS